MHRGHLGRDAVDCEDDVDEGQRQHHQEEWGDLLWIFPIEKKTRDFPHGDLTCGFFPIENVRFVFRKIPIRIVEKTWKNERFFVIVCYPRDDDLWCSMIFPGNIQIWHIWMLIWLCSTFSDCLWGKTSIIGSGKRVKTCGGARKLINKLSYGSVLKYCSPSRNVTNMSMKPTLETGTMMCFLQIAAVLVVWPEFMSHHNISGVPQSFKFPKSSQYMTLNG